MSENVTRSFVERMELEDSYALELVTDHDEDGAPRYRILLMPASHVEELRRTLAVKAVDLNDYGEVLAEGEGHTPPEGLIDELAGLIREQ